MSLPESFVQAGEKYIGVLTTKHIPCQEGRCYLHGLNTNTGFDCSGLIYRVLIDIEYPNPKNLRHVRDFFADGEFGQFIPIGEQRRGDLIIIPRLRKFQGDVPSHIGIMIDPEHYIQAGKVAGDRVSITSLVIKERRLNDLAKLRFPISPIGFKRLVF